LTRAISSSFWTEAARASGTSASAAADGDARKPRKSLRVESPPPLPAALLPTDDPLRLRLAEELDYARRLLDTMGDELAADLLIVSRHPTSLQSIDILGQMLGHFANVVRANDPEAAVERIGMCELKARLQRNARI
jgi:hypothetical protein